MSEIAKQKKPNKLKFLKKHRHGSATEKCCGDANCTGKVMLLGEMCSECVPSQTIVKSFRPKTKNNTDKIEVIIESFEFCALCDAQSTVPHAIQITRLRVANLCCAGEEKIIHSTLDNVKGVEHVAVNVIGRYAIVKHCSVSCCAPAAKIVELLNAKHLGVTIQEVAGGEDEEIEPIDKWQVFHVVVVSLLFCVGLVLHFSPSLYVASMGVYLASTALGVVPVLRAAYVTLVLRQTLDIHVLMLIAIVGAIAAEEYFDGSLVVSLFIGAELIESLVMRQVRMAVRISSTGTVAKEAFLVSGTKVLVVDLKVDDVLAVRAGEMVLGDGVVVKGEGVVDESALTGESEPVHKKVGSAMLSGTVVQNGYMEVRLTADTAGSTLSRLNQAVLDVQADRGEYARLVDQFSIYWTPGVLLTAFLFIVIGGSITKDWHMYLYRGLVLLVLACPCAIVIAAPIPAVCAISSAAKHGVLIRGSSVIERMGRVNAVALDKTGTLTKGFFKVNERLLLTEAGAPTFDPLQLAAAVEQKSTHPLANAVVAEFYGCIAEAADSIVMPSVRKIAVVDGVGVTGWVEVGGDWKQVSIGNEKLLMAQGGKVALTATQQKNLDAFVTRSVGGVTLLVCVDDQLEMALSLSDEVRVEAQAFVSTLRSMNLDVSMVTGDHEAVARHVSRQVGIREEDCFSRLLPSDKLAWVQDKQNPQRHKKGSTSGGLGAYSGLSSSEDAVRDIELAEPFIFANSSTDSDHNVPVAISKAQRVLMVGDGINDSTALTAASVGVAMGAGGSAMAVNSADVVLMSDNLQLLPASIKLCQMARRTIVEGFVFAIVVKIVAIVLAILGRMAFWQAIIIDIGSLVVVVINGTKPLYTAGLFRQQKRV